MKKNSAISFSILTLMLLVSCDNNKTRAGKVDHETPEALQDDNIEVKSFYRSSENNDLTEELYRELVGKTPNLKKLEDDIEALRSKEDELDESFNNYDGKSTNYYSSAQSKVSTIQDSILQKTILSIIESSQDKYSTKKSKLNSLQKIITQNNRTLYDKQTVLKILLTLQLIEKYQNDNLPDQKLFKDFIGEQKNIINRIDSLIPVH